ncbi:SOS response-associated peptidase family protein [Caulobacter segnis]|uniref:SOS response-associated peptidase family protein n=1 Tax=Caulobacter segnis TaxID=88688 RepID=UPI00240FE97A|nr:SOS response-associated peptidase family protein [Caulobacter segnis]MDG2520551.1 SOS response-associated peptidase family protein [Caulobacter segnis]
MCNEIKRKKDIGQVIGEAGTLGLPLTWAEAHHATNRHPDDSIRITDRTEIIRPAPAGGELQVLPWSWKGAHGAPVFNFRSEGRTFAREARCLVPITHFYEFGEGKPPKPKFEFSAVGDAPFGIAGIVREGAFTLLTCEPGADVAPYHKRQVVLLFGDQMVDWLHGGAEADLLLPTPAGRLQVERVR